jgi:hypothetical protein
MTRGGDSPTCMLEWDQMSVDQNSPDQTGETRNQFTLNSADVNIPCVRCDDLDCKVWRSCWYQHEPTWTDMNWHELTWTDMNWHELTWTDMNWHDLTWPDMTWHDPIWASRPLFINNLLRQIVILKARWVPEPTWTDLNCLGPAWTLRPLPDFINGCFITIC